MHGNGNSSVFEVVNSQLIGGTEENWVKWNHFGCVDCGENRKLSYESGCYHMWLVWTLQWYWIVDVALSARSRGAILSAAGFRWCCCCFPLPFSRQAWSETGKTSRGNQKVDITTRTAIPLKRRNSAAAHTYAAACTPSLPAVQRTAPHRTARSVDRPLYFETVRWWVKIPVYPALLISIDLIFREETNRRRINRNCRNSTLNEKSCWKKARARTCVVCLFGLMPTTVFRFFRIHKAVLSAFVSFFAVNS